jgi:signal transduction histidine kinase
MHGRRGHYDITVMPLRDRNGDVIGVSTAAVDITERKHAEMELNRAVFELNRAKETAEAASRAKDHFLATLSHELRTPLTPVLTSVEVLESDEELSERLRPFVDIIRRNVELEARLIDDILDHSRIINGKLRLKPEIVDIHALMRNVLDTCHAEMHDKKIALTVELSAIAFHVKGDPARLQQVFWNLVKNAIKFTPEGGRITVRSDNDNRGWLILHVEDTGIGIEPSIMPTIFDAFEQGGWGINRKFGGLGLGLAISRSLVEMHGGRLTAESAGRNRGATFTLALVVTEQQEAGDPATRPGESAGERKCGMILVVEDHADTATVMKLLLERKGYRVQIASGMIEALQWAANNSFNLLICDIGLPDGSGLELMQTLRMRGDIKGIALSGFGMEEDVRNSIEAGFAEHLTKPVSYHRLRESIERLLN